MLRTWGAAVLRPDMDRDRARRLGGGEGRRDLPQSSRRAQRKKVEVCFGAWRGCDGAVRFVAFEKAIDSNAVNLEASEMLKSLPGVRGAMRVALVIALASLGASAKGGEASARKSLPFAKIAKGRPPGD